jgi:hypothetical protein
MRSLVLIALLGGVAFADATTPAAKGAAMKRPVAYIVPAARGPEFYLSSGVTFWTPMQSDVDRLEAGLAAHLRSIKAGERMRRSQPTIADRLHEYARQYVGIVAGGKRKIWLTTYRIDESFPASRVTEPMMVKDGGDGFWRVTFDPKTSTYSDFNANGEG